MDKVDTRVDNNVVISSKFIFDDELLLNDDNQSVNGYLWAMDWLVDKLPFYKERDNINFYADYNVVTGDVEVTSTFYIHIGDKERQRIVGVELSDADKKELCDVMESYCQSLYGLSCLEFVNEIRLDKGFCKLAVAERASNDGPSYAPWREYSLSRKECDDYVDTMVSTIRGMGVDEGSGYYWLKSFLFETEPFNLFCEVSKEQEDGNVYYTVYYAVEYDAGDTIFADWKHTETMDLEELKDVVFEIASTDYTEALQQVCGKPSLASQIKGASEHGSNESLPTSIKAVDKQR